MGLGEAIRTTWAFRRLLWKLKQVSTEPELESARAQVPEERSAMPLPLQLTAPESVKRIKVSWLYCTTVGHLKLRRLISKVGLEVSIV